MPALALIGLLGGGYLVGAGLNKATTDAEDLTPKIAGMNAQTVMGGLGLVAMLLGGPLLAPLGVGTILASAVSYDATARFKTGLDKWLEGEVLRRIAEQGGGAPSQIEQATEAAKSILPLLQQPG